MKVCIIGAGCSGIIAAKELKDAKIPFDWYEIGSKIGGNWRYENDNGLSSMYASCRLDLGKNIMAFSDRPFPADWPVYMKHERYLQYLEDYVAAHDLERRVTFNSEVTSAEPLADGRWRVTLKNRKSAQYDALVVANGHYWDPKYPDFDGKFEGKVLHSHHFRTADPFRGKRVLIVGIGSSASDVACDVARVAKATYLSTRRSTHVVPRYVLGIPVFSYLRPVVTMLPMGLQRAYMNILFWLGRGSMRSYGFPAPDHKLFEENPTISSELLERVASSEIQMKPNVERLRKGGARFVDGSDVDLDAIIYATGYHMTFPFFRNRLVNIGPSGINNYKHVISLDQPNLYFVGLVQPVGSVPPCAEMQSKWIAKLLSGRGRPPPRAQMEEHIRSEQRRLKAQYRDPSKHQIKVGFAAYLMSIRDELLKPS